MWVVKFSKMIFFFFFFFETELSFKKKNIQPVDFIVKLYYSIEFSQSQVPDLGPSYFLGQIKPTFCDPLSWANLVGLAEFSD